MKSPQQLAAKLARQWYSADQREARLLNPDGWPLVLSIGKPSAAEFANSATMKSHLQQWRDVSLGQVQWQSVSYRDASEPVAVPITWTLASPSQWIEATADQSVQMEYRHLAQIIQGLDARFHRSVIRQRSIIMERSAEDVIKAAELTLQLTPGCASGRPLRALSLAGIDSKFFERHRQLIVQFLDLCFDGEVSDQGLETFLNAANSNDHWLLVVPLAPGLLPFEQQRIRSRELQRMPLPADRILLVENERCWHQLPPMQNTIAVLGSGLNLSWMQAPWLAQKRIAYWGDMDTWGLYMLARARHLQPDLTPLLMNHPLFEQYADQAVAEPTQAGSEPPQGLTADEAAFYRYLQERGCGRLEQEFLPADAVGEALTEWGQLTS